MKASTPYQVKTIREYHRLNNLPKPQHPLISVVRFEDLKHQSNGYPKSITNNFYCVALKKTFNAKMKYGQHEYDFDEGVLAFIVSLLVVFYRKFLVLFCVFLAKKLALI